MSEINSDTSNITEWLANLRKNEAEQSARASAIIEKHLVNAGLPFKSSGETKTWSSCGWDLYLNVEKLLQDYQYHDVLRPMFVELVDFCEVSTSESFAYKLKILFEKFIQSYTFRSKLLPLLPNKAYAQLDEINRMLDDDHENYMEILNQQGY